MPQKNQFLDSAIPYLYRRQTMDLLAFAFIDAYRFAQPSVTLKEAALAFMTRYKVSHDLFDVNSVIMTYNRVNKDLIDAQREENQGARAGQ
jgi:hypothetical protein